tara:strand:+ start:22446 stop:23138 length:693 start_codon:yes stop_codon:yes gene_type:complete
MKQLSDILFLVQARLSSSRLPEKMIKPFAGTNLTQIAIDRIKESIIPNPNFYLSINEDKLIHLAKSNNINIYNRGTQSIRNDDSIPFSLTEVFEWWDKLPFKYYIIMNACNPLITTQTINNFIKEFQKIEGGLLSVKEHKHWFYKKNGSFVQENYGNEDAKITFNSKYVETLYSNGPLKGGILKDIGENIYSHNFSTIDPNLWVYPNNEYVDIDYEWEFKLAEELYKIKT